MLGKGREELQQRLLDCCFLPCYPGLAQLAFSKIKDHFLRITYPTVAFFINQTNLENSPIALCTRPSSESHISSEIPVEDYLKFVSLAKKPNKQTKTFL